VTARAEALLLAVDTATKSAIVALGDGVGPPAARHGWAVGHRHGETLLPRIEDALREAGATVRDVGGVIVGVGPGSFTGLRVGMTVAKTLAYGLSVPIVGVGTLDALAAASGEAGAVVVSLPAGPTDRYVARFHVTPGRIETVEAPRLVPPGETLTRDAGTLVAVDADGEAVDPEPRQRGLAAVDRLGDVLLVLGATRLGEGRADDPAVLVPAYVTLPRGLPRALAESAWSPDLR
jgi:tRNA threonylcarbamoyl adenosine modification protein YeaZ